MSKQPDPAALQELLDKQEISELQTRYMFALDWHEPDIYASVFTEDGILEWPEGHAKGKEAIRNACVGIGKFYAGLAAANPRAKAPFLKHFVMNRLFDIRGDKARVWAYWLDLFNDNQGRWPYVAGYGYYEDDLVRTADGWKFSHRKVFNDINAESPKEYPARWNG